MFRKGQVFVLVLLCLILFASTLYADVLRIRLYDEEVVSDVDINKYLQTGTIKINGVSSTKQNPLPGPAPAPYPHIHMWEAGIERLGSPVAQIDGIEFHNAGTFLVSKKWLLVFWKIQIPQASLRFASEFEQDLTMSMWLDWNEDDMWGKNEKLVCKHINLHEYFPTTYETVSVYYLTKFRIPEFGKDDPLMAQKWQNKDLRKLWFRCVLSYDDPDVSPDGEQLFGEVEDYRLTFMMTGREMDKD